MPVTRERIEPGIVRRKAWDGSWTYEIEYRSTDGKQRRQTVGSKLAIARTELAKIKAAKGSGERVIPQPLLTFGVAAERWYESTAQLRPNTRQGYRICLDRHLLPVFGTRRLGDVSVDQVAVFVAQMGSLDYARDLADRDGRNPDEVVALKAKTIRASLIVMGRVFQHARRRQGFPGSNPVEALENSERPRDAEPLDRRILSRAELDALVACTPAPYDLALLLMAALGLRISEALGLRWDNVDLTAGTVTVAGALHRSGERQPLKTRASYRRLDAPGALVARLRKHKIASEDTADTSYVLITAPGMPLSDRQLRDRVLPRAWTATGLPGRGPTPHELRHMHGSALIEEGWSLPAVSKRLGHAGPQITAQVYVHEFEQAEKRDEQRAALDRLYGPDDTASGLRVVGS